MADPKGFTSLKAFVDSIQSAKHSTFAEAHAEVAHEDAFAEMKAGSVRRQH